MEKFRTATYEVHNPKIKKSVRFAVLADLHGSIFGEENSALLKKIQTIENIYWARKLFGTAAPYCKEHPYASSSRCSLRLGGGCWFLRHPSSRLEPE